MAARLEWASEQEKVLKKIQPAAQTCLPLGPYDPADPMMLHVAAADRYAV